MFSTRLNMLKRFWRRNEFAIIIRWSIIACTNIFGRMAWFWREFRLWSNVFTFVIWLGSSRASSNVMISMPILMFFWAAKVSYTISSHLVCLFRGTFTTWSTCLPKMWNWNMFTWGRVQRYVTRNSEIRDREDKECVCNAVNESKQYRVKSQNTDCGYLVYLS